MTNSKSTFVQNSSRNARVQTLKMESVSSGQTRKFCVSQSPERTGTVFFNLLRFNIPLTSQHELISDLITCEQQGLIVLVLYLFLMSSKLSSNQTIITMHLNLLYQSSVSVGHACMFKFDTMTKKGYVHYSYTYVCTYMQFIVQFNYYILHIHTCKHFYTKNNDCFICKNIHIPQFLLIHLPTVIKTIVVFPGNGRLLLFLFITMFYLVKLYHFLCVLSGRCFP